MEVTVNDIATMPIANGSLLLALNDDCLLHIMAQLALADFGALACCSRRLQWLAREQIFKRNAAYKKLSLSTFCTHSTPSISMQIECYLHTFGDLLTGIDFTHPNNTKQWGEREYDVAIESEVIFHHIIKYCHNTLLTLKMDHIYLTFPSVPAGPVPYYFSCLQSLHLERCLDLSADKEHLKHTRPERVTIDWHNTVISQVLQRFVRPEALDRLHLYYITIDQDFYAVLSRYRNLCDLKIAYANQYEYRFSVETEHQNMLQSLRSLRTVALTSTEGAALFLCNVGSPATVEYLEMQDCDWNEQAIAGFVRFTNVRILKLYSICFEDLGDDFGSFVNCDQVVEFALDNCFRLRSGDLISIVMRMKSLQVLKLGAAFKFCDRDKKMTDAMYLRLVQIYQHRMRQLRIECTFRHGETQDTVSEAMLRNHREFVDIVRL